MKWQHDLESRALVGLAPHVDVSAMGNDQLLDQVEANAQATDALGINVAGAIEALEEERKRLLGDANSGVVDCEMSLVVGPDPHVDGSTPRTIFEGVADEMADDLIEALWIAPDGHRLTRSMNNDRMVDRVGV